jgi:hypothetical protein
MRTGAPQCGHGASEKSFGLTIFITTLFRQLIHLRL